MKSSPGVSIALPKGRTLKEVVALFQKAGFLGSQLKEDSRRLFLEGIEPGDRFLLLRDTDVPTYVEYGACDLGVAGKDQLAEQERNVYEPLDLRFGYCRMVVAEPETLRKEDDPSLWSHIRVATKYPRLTEKYFLNKGVQAEIIKLYGSVELAPLGGLCERIVDLVSTGETLRQNGLVEVEQIMEVTSRLIVNRASLKTKHSRIRDIIERLQGLI
ncbi:MAG: ATP phosphoribosyltransferase [Thermodesulfobacteriota bacterium]